MPHGNYWETREGRLMSTQLRALTALHLVLPFEPRSKKSSKGKHALTHSSRRSVIALSAGMVLHPSR